MLSRQEHQVWDPIQASHHRGCDTGAVLGVIDALRFASTQPTAGPSGIDHASARHVSGFYAMVGGLMTTRNGDISNES